MNINIVVVVVVHVVTKPRIFDLKEARIAKGFHCLLNKFSIPRQKINGQVIRVVNNFLLIGRGGGDINEFINEDLVPLAFPYLVKFHYYYFFLNSASQYDDGLLISGH